MKTVSIVTLETSCDNLQPNFSGKFYHYENRFLTVFCQCRFPGFDTICTYEECYHWGKLHEVYI